MKKWLALFALCILVTPILPHDGPHPAPDPRQLSSEEIAFRKEMDSLFEKTSDELWDYIAKHEPILTKAVSSKGTRDFQIELAKMNVAIRIIGSRDRAMDGAKKGGWEKSNN